MNLFIFFAEDHLQNARSHDDKTVIKLALECAQVLATASSHHGLLPALTSQGTPYKMTHASHPCTIWLTESKVNYLWAIDYLQSLLDEQERRYGRRSTHLQNACNYYSQQTEDWACGRKPNDFAVAINVKFLKVIEADDLLNASEVHQIVMTKRATARIAEQAYRRYLRIAKCHYACWLHSEPPDFWLAEHASQRELFANGHRRVCRYKPVPVRAVAPVGLTPVCEVSAWQVIDACCGRRQKVKQELMQILIAEGEHAALSALYKYI